MEWFGKQSESKGLDQWKKMSEAIDNAKKKEQLITLESLHMMSVC